MKVFRPDRTILLVKYAKGGSLAKAWHPEIRGQNYDSLLEEYRLATKGRQVELAAIIWTQGSGDSSSEEMAKAYAANLKALIQRLRKDLAAPALPFVYGSFPSEDLLKGQQGRVQTIDGLGNSRGPTAFTPRFKQAMIAFRQGT